jgi:hypothetical protein
MFEVLKTEKFAIVFSFILGFALVAVGYPVCRGEECFVKKAPLVSEMKTTTYKLGSKCYQFRPESVDCPVKGAIEAFQTLGSAADAGRA